MFAFDIHSLPHAERVAKDKRGASAVEAVARVEKQGHRSDVRVLDFSSDSTGMMSASAEALKIWTRYKIQHLLSRSFRMKTVSLHHSIFSVYAV